MSSKRAPVLALIGDRYHNADFLRVNFNKLFAEMGLEYEYTLNYEWFADEAATAAQLEGRSVLIVGRDGLNFTEGYVGPEAYGHYVTGLMNDFPSGPPSTWVSEGFSTAVRDFVRGGGGLFAWHNSLSVATFSPIYREVAGGEYDGHPAERPWKVEVVNHDHPITAGIDDFIVTDEQHFPLYDGPESDLLLKGINIDELTFDSDSGALKGATVSNTAWAREYGEGRVVQSAIGHNLDALWKPSYWRFQTQAIRWLLREI
jgi:hypothetical protein